MTVHGNKKSTSSARNVSALLVPICCPFPLLAMRCCSTPLLPSGAVRWQKQAVSLTHFSWPKMLAPSMCCRIVLEGERQSSGYGETHIERNSCATVIKLENSVFSEVGVERHQFWQCLSILPSFWKFSKKSKKKFPICRCPVMVVVIDVYQLLTSTLICDLAVAIISIIYVEHIEGKKASGLQSVKI